MTENMFIQRRPRVSGRSALPITFSYEGTPLGEIIRKEPTVEPINPPRNLVEILSDGSYSHITPEILAVWEPLTALIDNDCEGEPEDFRMDLLMISILRDGARPLMTHGTRYEETVGLVAFVFNRDPYGLAEMIKGWDDDPIREYAYSRMLTLMKIPEGRSFLKAKKPKK